MSDHALIDAIERGDTATVRKLLIEGADPNEFVATEYEKRTTPLIVAAVSDASRPEMIQILLDAGADLRIGSGRFGTTALWWARGPEGPAKRKVLLDAGADPFESAGNGRTILGEVTRADDLQTFDRLIAMGVDPFPTDYKHDFQHPYFLAVEEGAISILRRYLDWGMDPNAKTLSGDPILHLANSSEAARMLVEAGADIEARNESGWTTLVKSFGNWHPYRETIELVGTLIELGADVNDTHDHGFSVLMSAVSSGRNALAYAQILITHGANPLHVSDFGVNLLHAIIDDFYNDDREDATDCSELIRFLIYQGVDLEGRNKWGFTPLLTAAFSGDTVNAISFIEAGANVNARILGEDGQEEETVLIGATYSDSLANALLAAGADPRATDQEGQTALDHARRRLSAHDSPPRPRRPLTETELATRPPELVEAKRMMEIYDSNHPEEAARYAAERAAQKVAKRTRQRERLVRVIAILEAQ